MDVDETMDLPPLLDPQCLVKKLADPQMQCKIVRKLDKEYQQASAKERLNLYSNTFTEQSKLKSRYFELITNNNITKALKAEKLAVERQLWIAKGFLEKQICRKSMAEVAAKYE